VVICELWRSAVAIPRRVYEWSINSFTNPNPLYDYSHTHIHVTILTYHCKHALDVMALNLDIFSKCHLTVYKLFISVISIKSGWRVELKTLLPSMSRLSRKCLSLDLSHPMGLHGLLQGHLSIKSFYHRLLHIGLNCTHHTEIYTI
jgi:hypothetical protein